MTFTSRDLRERAGERPSPLTRHTRAVGALSGLVLLAGCASSSSPATDATANVHPVTEATVQLAWLANVQNMGPYVAESNRLYSEAGIDVTLIPGGPSTTVEPIVASGQALVGVANLDSVARAVAEGANLTVVASVIQQNPQVIVSLASAPIPTLDDLVGKSLCAASIGQTSLEEIFEANDIDPVEVAFVTADADPAPLVAGECDAFHGYANNQPVTLNLAGIDTVDFLLADYGFNIWTNVMFVRTESLSDPAERAAIEAIVAATAQGWEEALADTDRAAELIVSGPGASLNLDLEQQRLAAESFIPLVQTIETEENGLLTMSEGSVRANVDTLASIGVDADLSLFDLTVLPAR